MTEYGTLRAPDRCAERNAIDRMVNWVRSQKFYPLHWVIPNDGSWTHESLAGIAVRRTGLDGSLHLVGRRSWLDPQCTLCSLYRDPDGPRVEGLPDGSYSASRPERARRPLSRSLLVAPALAGVAAFMAPSASATSPEPGPTPNRADQLAGSPVDDALHVTAGNHGMEVMSGGNGTGLGNAQLQDKAELEAEAQKWVQQNVIGEDGADLDFFGKLEGTADPSEGLDPPPAPGASQNFQDAYAAGQAARERANREAEDADAAAADAAVVEEDAAVEDPPPAEDSGSSEGTTGAELHVEASTPEPPGTPEPVEPEPVAVAPSEPMPLPEPVEPPVLDAAPDDGIVDTEPITDPEVADGTVASSELTPAELRERAGHYREAAEHLDTAADAIEAGDNVGTDGAAADLDGQGGGTDEVAAEPVGDTGTVTVDLDLGPVQITVNGEPQTVRIQLDGVELDVDGEIATVASGSQTDDKAA